MRILIVDDHQLFIDGIRHIVTALDRDIEILEANSAFRAIEHLDANKELDMVLLDLHMPGPGGGSVMQHQRVQNGLPIVIISGEQDLNAIKSVIDAGAMGFISKSDSGEDLLSALHTIIDGGVYIPEAIRSQLHSLSTDQPDKRDYRGAVNNTRITRRQHEVLQLLSNGHSNKQISNKLSLTENTVKAHVSALLRTLGASNRTECVSIARGKGLIP